jgi:hypothetical protein
MRGDLFVEPASMLFYPVPLDSVSRANFGIVNDSTMAHTFHVSVRTLNEAGELGDALADVAITVPAHAMAQAAVPEPLALLAGPDAAYAIEIRRTASSGGAWTSYVSSIDKLTNDGVLVRPLPRLVRVMP